MIVYFSDQLQKSHTIVLFFVLKIITTDIVQSYVHFN